jgi:hypothetical protein
LNTSGYVIFEALDESFTIDDITYVDNTFVDESGVSHTFEDESGLLYYVPKAVAGDTVSFVSIAPAYGPKKDGYTFKACDMSSPTCHHGVNN